MIDHALLYSYGNSMSSDAVPFSRWDIGRPDSLDIVGMPLLEAHVWSLHARTLAAVHLLYINHAISDALMVARAFRRLSAEVTSVLVPYRGRDGGTHRATCQGFRHIGHTIVPQPTSVADFSKAMAVAVSEAIRQVALTAAAQGREWMIVEDGGYAFPALHDDSALRPYLSSCLGAVEHTTRGRLNYQFLETDGSPLRRRRLLRPAVTIASSRLKTAHEADFVAQGLMDECNWLLRRDHQFLRHRPVAVLGYGRVGKALARALARQDSQVMVVDPAVTAQECAHTLVVLSEAIRNEVFLIFGATGTSSMTVADLSVWLREGQQDTLYLVSASSKNIEFAQVADFFSRAEADPRLLERASKREGSVACRVDPHTGLRYTIRFADHMKTCVLLANGYPVIFFPPDTHGAPNRAMDPVMTQLFLAACGLPDGHTTLEASAYSVDDLRDLQSPRTPPAWRALADEHGLLTQWCVLNHIEPTGYLQRIGFLTYPHPDSARGSTPLIERTRRAR